MQATLEDFFKALRGATLEPTLDSEVDAARAVELIGWSDRQRLKDALGTTLAKSVLERDLFDEAFDRFFMFDAFAEPPPGAGEPEGADPEGGTDAGDAPGGQGQSPGDEDGDGERGPQEPGTSAQGDGRAGGDTEGAAQGKGGGGGGGGTSRPDEIDADALAALLLKGDQAALAQRLLRAAREVGVTDIWLRTQRGWYTQRIQQAMGVGALNRAILAADEAVERAAAGGPGEGAGRGDSGRNGDGGDSGGDRSGASARAARLRLARDRLFQEVRAFVERQIQLYAGAPTRALMEDALRDRALSSIERRDLPRVREIVQRIARKLAARHARRQRRQRRGTLDVRRTIRRNAAYGGVMFEPVWRTEVVDRPRVIVICDVSGSVSAYARFLLLFVYSLQELMSDLRSFAFISELVDVSGLFESMPLERAIDEVINSVGGSGSDYGRMLQDVDAQLLPAIDRRTTVIVLGDARNNNGEARVDLLEAVHRRARRVIWLNPESRASWGSGDSEMLRYRVHCDLARECRSIRDLERVLDDLLRHRGANA